MTKNEDERPVGKDKHESRRPCNGFPHQTQSPQCAFRIMTHPGVLIRPLPSERERKREKQQTEGEMMSYVEEEREKCTEMSEDSLNLQFNLQMVRDCMYTLLPP